MKEYHMFGAGTDNYFPFIKGMIVNMKQFKKKDCKYIFHVILVTDNIQYYCDQAKQYNSDDFQVKIIWGNKFENIIKKPIDTIHYSSYLRCLAFNIFSDIDKILQLDLDMILINPGLQEFMDTDVTDKYCAAVSDPFVIYKVPEQMNNVKTKTYFNAGAVVLNLRKVREDRADLQILKAVTGYYFKELELPHFNDQTIINYVFQDNVVYCDPKFNNVLISTMRQDADCYYDFYLREWGYKSFDEAVSKAVILHYAGIKPWSQQFKKYYNYMLFPQVSDFTYRYFIQNKQ